MLNGKTILITGGTGSFGKKFVQTVLGRYKPEKLIIFSRDELKQFEMWQKWGERDYPCIRYVIGDVRDRERLSRSLAGVDFVIHAAALKQVPSAEYNPEECIKTNVLGATNVIAASLDNGVKKVVALSTDKACNPINLYGATKLCSDKLFVAANVYGGSAGSAEFSVVRYGNVLGSRGSVVPFFMERSKTGVLPVTDKRMTRFWITLTQGVEFVLQALKISNGGEIFVPKIPSMKITDLATAIAPECRQEVAGIRPGEKLHESLIGEEDGRNAFEYDDYYVISRPSWTSDVQKELPKGGKKCPEGFKYTSDANPSRLSVEELRRMLEEIEEDYTIEKTRWLKKDVPK